MDEPTSDRVSSPESANTSLVSVMDSEIQNASSSNYSKLLFWMKEGYEARRRFPNAKSISSADFFGDQLKVDEKEAQVFLQKFSTSTAISSADLFGHTVNKPPCIRSYAEFRREYDKMVDEDTTLIGEAFEEYKKEIASYVSWLTKLFW